MTVNTLELWQDRAMRHLKEIAQRDFGTRNGFHALVAMHHIEQIRDGLTGSADGECQTASKEG